MQGPAFCELLGGGDHTLTRGLQLVLFGKKGLPGIFLGYELTAWRIWKEDILSADLEELEKLDASDVCPRRINAKEVLIRKMMMNSYSQQPPTRGDPPCPTEIH